MSVLLYMLAAAIALALGGLAALAWAVWSGQFDDPKGDAVRILTDQEKPL